MRCFKELMGIVEKEYECQDKENKHCMNSECSRGIWREADDSTFPVMKRCGLCSVVDICFRREKERHTNNGIDCCISLM